MSKLIFVAVPTKGVVTDGKMNESFHRDVARLHELFPDHTFVAPMIQDYAILPHMTTKTATWEAWGAHCRRLIAVSDAVWVIMYDGYDTSVGVAGEIECASQHGVPITMIHLSMFEEVVQ